MKQFVYRLPFILESGDRLDEVVIAYQTYGSLNSDRSNVVWICHHLTANADAALWWQGIIGPGMLFDPARHYIVCANILGSCYGSSGPLTVQPGTNELYYLRFPAVTIRDMVRAHMLLREQLGITSIALLIGGSMGGYQALEWAAMEPGVIQSLVLLSTSAAESAWGIAVHTAQRLAIEADCSWRDNSPEAGRKGLKAARAIGLISYRNHRILVDKQSDNDPEKMGDYKASSYIIYQGEKLVSRFHAHSYWLLTKAMDSHHLGRGRGGSAAAVLRGFRQPALVVGTESDILCPLAEQQFLAENIPGAGLVTIDSAYGHDGFMVESAAITRHIRDWSRSAGPDLLH